MKIALTNFAACAAMTLVATETGTWAQAGLVLSVDAAGAQSSTVAGVTTETFNSFGQGQYASLSTAGGTPSTSGELSIVKADSYGGAGGTGHYFAVGSPNASADPVTLTLSGPQSYFGMWWSAADANNSVQLYSGNTLLGELSYR